MQCWATDSERSSRRGRASGTPRPSKDRGRFPIAFKVGVDLDVIIAEPTIGALTARGPMVSLADTSNILRLEEEVPLESRVIYKNYTLHRSVGVEATVSLEGADEEKYRDLRVTRVLPF